MNLSSSCLSYLVFTSLAHVPMPKKGHQYAMESERHARGYATEKGYIVLLVSSRVVELDCKGQTYHHPMLVVDVFIAGRNL